MATNHHIRSIISVTTVLIFLVIGVFQATKVKSLGDLKCIDCGEHEAERRYYLYAGEVDAPANDQEDLLLILHGFRSSAKGTIATTRRAFERYADTEGMVVVHAQALGPNWAFGDSGSIGQSYDKAYFDAPWNDVRTYYPSLQRIHLIGLSRGAMAAYFLACDNVLPVSSLSVFVMPMPEHTFDNCQTEKPIDFMLANGTEDDLVPYNGGAIHMPWYTFPSDRNFGSILSTEDTLAYWRNHNGCEVDPNTSTTLDDQFDGTFIVHRNWDNCFLGTVSHYEVVGGGHRWLNERWNPVAWVLLGWTSREVYTDGTFDVY
ncbi:MAG: hypothetical protein ABJM43_02895 [Paracoccaceae bacterium]